MGFRAVAVVWQQLRHLQLGLVLVEQRFVVFLQLWRLTVTKPLEERHPALLVQNVFTFGVVIATNGGPFRIPAEEIRDAIVKALPPGTGVGKITCTDHGPYGPWSETK